MRAMLVPISALLLSACASGDASLTMASAPPPPSEWKFDRKHDQILGAPSANAWLLTNDVKTSTGLPTHAFLQLMCFKGEPVVRLIFLRPVGANRSAAVAYRFDEKPGRDANVRFLRDFKTVIIEKKDDVVLFADELVTSANLFVRVTSLVGGRGQTSAQFRVHGAARAVDVAFADCPLAAKPRRPSA